MTAEAKRPALGDSAVRAASARALWAARAYYFLFYGAVGVYYPYISLYFRQTGLSGEAIGVLAALTPLALIVAGPAWGALGDRFRIQRHLLPFVTWATIAPTLAIVYMRPFSGLAALVTLASLFSAPIIPLIDSAALDLAEGTTQSYGRLRVWGTPGYILMTYAMGSVLKLTGLGGLFYVYAGMMMLAGLAALWLPARQHKIERRNFRRGLGQFLRHRSVGLFLISAFLAGISFTAYNAFFSLHLQDMGGSLYLVGLANVLSALSELPVLFFSARLIRRLGAGGALLLGYGAYTVRWCALALARIPLVALITQTLHGVSWGATTVGSVAYMQSHSPKGLEATGQSVLGSATSGLGAAVGALGSGWLYDRFGGARLFLVMSACCALGLLSMLAAMAGQRQISNE